MESGRKSERVTINKEFESFDQFMSEYVTNLSRSGAFIRTSTPLPESTSRASSLARITLAWLSESGCTSNVRSCAPARSGAQA